MFNEAFIKSTKGFVIYLVIYTLAFILFFGTMSYTFPFILAFAVAFIIQPVTRFFKERLKLTKSIPSLLSSILVYFVILGLIVILFYNIIAEATQLLKNLPSINLDPILVPIRSGMDEIGLYLKDIDPSFVEKSSSQISGFITQGLSLVGRSLSAFLSVALSIPMWITMIFIIILSTYFFSRDMSVIQEKLMSSLSEKGREKFSKVYNEGIRMLTRYVKAYLIIYSLTFIQTLIGLSIFRVKYAFILSILCMISDVLPILGIGLIYLPLVAIYFISGNFLVAVGLIILYLVITIVRQIVEPKIVSSSLGIHPIAALAVIFIGLKAYGFIGMIYLTFLLVFYKVFKASKLI